MARGTLYITGKPEADRLLNTDGTALLIGMLLDQQVPMEWAFAGPATLRERLGHLDAKRIAAMTPDEFVAVCCAKPAIHRFPASLGRRIHELCGVLATEYRGKGANVWKGVESGAELYRRLRSLPGYGDEKARIFVAILAKRMSMRPEGWQQAAGPFADDTPRSVADIHDPASLALVRQWKQAAQGRQARQAGPPAALSDGRHQPRLLPVDRGYGRRREGPAAEQVGPDPPRHGDDRGHHRHDLARRTHGRRATVNVSVDAGGVPGMVGVDAIYGGAGGGGAYDDFEWYDTNGRLREPLVVPIAIPPVSSACGRSACDAPRGRRARHKDGNARLRP